MASNVDEVAKLDAAIEPLHLAETAAADAQLPTSSSEEEPVNKEDYSLCGAPQSEWLRLEKKFEAHRTYKSVDGIPSNEQLELARLEWNDRFMRDDGEDSGVPAVLVAVNVPMSWERDESIHSRFLLTQTGELYLTKD